MAAHPNGRRNPDSDGLALALLGDFRVSNDFPLSSSALCWGRFERAPLGYAGSLSSERNISPHALQRAFLTAHSYFLAVVAVGARP